MGRGVALGYCRFRRDLRYSHTCFEVLRVGGGRINAPRALLLANTEHGAFCDQFFPRVSSVFRHGTPPIWELLRPPTFSYSALSPRLPITIPLGEERGELSRLRPTFRAGRRSLRTRTLAAAP